jgi:negative regulator of sigma E activity
MNHRDVELLSAYLDGELKPSDSAKLEARLKTDPELASVLNDLRSTRALLRKLPQRRAPRNFTLTRKMVGQNPPMPRVYPLFRFATAFAAVLLFFSFAVNTMGPQLMSPPNFGSGGGGGAEEMQSFAAEALAATESPAEEPAAAEAMPAAPASTMLPEPTNVAADSGPALEASPPMTATAPAEETQRIIDTPVAKNGETENAIQREIPPLISSVWQVGLAIIVLLGIIMLVIMRQVSASHWK